MVTPRKTGDFVTGSLAGKHYRAFVPASLPPEPPLVRARSGEPGSAGKALFEFAARLRCLREASVANRSAPGGSAEAVGAGDFENACPLEDAGVISEVTGQRRNRIWSYGEYFALLSEGTEPL